MSDQPPGSVVTAIGLVRSHRDSVEVQKLAVDVLKALTAGAMMGFFWGFMDDGGVGVVEVMGGYQARILCCEAFPSQNFVQNIFRKFPIFKASYDPPSIFSTISISSRALCFCLR